METLDGMLLLVEGSRSDRVNKCVFVILVRETWNVQPHCLVCLQRGKARKAAGKVSSPSSAFKMTNAEL